MPQKSIVLPIIVRRVSNNTYHIEINVCTYVICVPYADSKRSVKRIRESRTIEELNT